MNIAYLAPEFGALSSTFVYREVAELERLGFTVSTLSTRRPSDSVMSAEAVPFAERTAYLRERGMAGVLFDVAVCALTHPLRFGRVCLTAIRDATACEAPTNMDRPKLVWHFLQGCTIARWLAKAGAQHVHAHFAHVPTSIAMYGAMLAGIPFSFTAHANDIFERGVALREKVSRAKFVACISNFNRAFLADRGCDASKMHVVRCGIDPAVYTLREPRPFNDPPSIVLVARMIEKKGVHVLLDALARLRDRGVPFHATLVGEGPLEEDVRLRIRITSLEGMVHMMGAQPQEIVREVFESADMFVLPCVPAESGDMDGIPVVLIESLASGVPVVSTTVSGIPELVESGEHGVLVPPEDAGALADAIEEFIQNPDLARRYAEAGRRRVEDEFSIAGNVEKLARLIRLSDGDD